MPGADWDVARREMLLDPRITYFNCGSFGPLPRIVSDRIAGLRRQLAEEPMDFQLRLFPRLLCHARTMLSEYIGAEPGRLIFTTNVTAAVNLVASSLRLESPGEILLTDHEYEPMAWCWERAARRLGLTVRTFAVPMGPAGAHEIVGSAIKAMRPYTRLFFFSHVLSSTGLIMPAKALCGEARARGIVTMVDGAQAPGHIELNVADLQCDFYAGSGHKWLLGPQGIGFLYASGGNAARLEPLQVSWGYRSPRERSASDAPDVGIDAPVLRSFECEGTRDLCPWLAVPTAIDFHRAIGVERVRRRMRELADLARRRIAAVPGTELVTPDQPDLRGAMVSFRLPGHTDALLLQRALWEQFRIEVSLIERRDALLLRVSTHVFNSETEIDRLVEALSQLIVP